MNEVIKQDRTAFQAHFLKRIAKQRRRYGEVPKSSPVCVSFPCSGRNWINDITNTYIGHVSGIVLGISGGQFCLSSIENSTGKILYSHDILNSPWDDILTWKDVFKISNDYMAEAYGNTPLVILMRDPRDVMVSYFHQKKHREPWLKEIGQITTAGSFLGYIDDFVNNEIYGIRTLCEFMNLWVDYLKNEHATMITYEAMNTNPMAEMSRALTHMGINIDVKCLAAAIKENTFGASLERELRNMTVVYNNTGSQDTRKCRKGKVGGWKEELTGKALEIVEDTIDKHLHEYYRPLYARL